MAVSDETKFTANVFAQVDGLSSVDQLVQRLKLIDQKLKTAELSFRQFTTQVRQLQMGDPNRQRQLAAGRGELADIQGLIQLRKAQENITKIMQGAKIQDPYNVRELREAIKIQEQRVLLFKRGSDEEKKERDLLREMYGQLTEARRMEQALNAEVRFRNGLETQLLRLQDQQIQKMREEISLEQQRARLRQEANGAFTSVRQETRIAAGINSTNDRLAGLRDPGLRGAREQLTTEQQIIAAQEKQTRLARQLADAESIGNDRKMLRLRAAIAENNLHLLSLQGISRENAAYQQQLALLRSIHAEQAAPTIRSGASQDSRVSNLVEARLAGLSSEGRGSLLALQGSLLLNYGLLNTFIGGLRNAVTFSVTFEAELRNLQAIVGATDTQMSVLANTIVEVASGTKFAASEIVAGTQVLAQAGFSISEIDAALKPIVQFAAATGTELKTAVDIITTTITAFNLTVADTERISNVFTAALNQSKLSIDQLSLGFQYAANIASQSGVTFTEMTAILGGMANAGIKSGSTLGTGFRQVLIELQNPSEEFQKRITRLGLTMADVDVKTLGVVNVFERLRAAGFTSADALASFETRTAAAAIAIENQIDTIRELEIATTNTNAAAEANAKQMESLQSTYTAFTNTLQIMIADALSPLQEALQETFKFLNDLLKAVGVGDPIIRGFVTALATALTGLLLVAIFNVTAAFLSFTVGAVSFGSVIAGTTLAVAGLATGTLTLSGAFTTLAAAFGGVPGLIIAITSVAVGLATAFGGLGESTADLKAQMESVRTKQNDLKDSLKGTETVLGSLQQAVDRIIDRWDILNTSTPTLRSEMASLASQFGTLGLNIDFAADSAQTLISKLIQLQGQQVKVIANNAAMLVQEANKGINTGGATLLSQQGDTRRQLWGWTGNSPLNDRAKALAAKINIGDPNSLTKENLDQILFNSGYEREINDLINEAQKLGDESLLKGLNMLRDQVNTMRDVYNQINLRDSAMKQQEQAERASGTLSNAGYPAVVSTISGADQTLKEIRAAALKIADPIERKQYLDTQLMRVQNVLAALEANVQNLGAKDREALEAQGIRVEDKLAELRSTADNFIRGVVEEYTTAATAESKNALDTLNQQVSNAIKQQSRPGGAHRVSRDKFITMVDNWKAATREQDLVETGLAEMIAAGQIDPVTFEPTGENIPRKLVAARKAFEARQEAADLEYLQKIDDYDNASQVADKKGRGGGSRDVESLLMTRLNNLKKRAVDGSSDETIVGVQQEAIALIEKTLGISMDALRSRLEANPGAAVSEADFAGVDERTKAQLVGFFDSIGRIISTNLDQFLQNLRETTEEQALEFQRKQRELLGGYQSAERKATAEANAYGNTNLPGVFGAAAERRATNQRRLAFNVASVELERGRVEQMRANVQSLNAALEQSKASMAELEARRDGGDYTAEAAIVDLRKQQTAATKELVDRTAELQNAEDDLAGKTEALHNAETMRNGTLGEMARLTVEAWSAANEATNDVNVTLSETLTAGLDAASQGFATFFKDIVTGSKSAGEAFQDLAVTILDAMLDVIVSELAKQFLQLIIGSFGGGGIVPGGEVPGASSGGGGGGGGLIQGGFVRAAQGRKTRRAVRTRDSVPILAQPGEAIIRSSAVQMIGEEGIEELNALGNRRVSRASRDMPAPPAPGPSSETNVYVVSKDRVPTLGPNDVLAVVGDDIERGGSIKQLIKRVQTGV